MNVNEKGIRGLIKVMDDLQEKGFYLFPAFDDHSPIDLIAIKDNGQTYRLQIKYRKKDNQKISTKYTIHAHSVVNGKKIPINRNMIDGWAVYLVEDKKVVYIHKSLMENQKGLTIDPTKEYSQLTEWFMGLSC